MTDRPSYNVERLLLKWVASGYVRSAKLQEKYVGTVKVSIQILVIEQVGGLDK